MIPIFAPLICIWGCVSEQLSGSIWLAEIRTTEANTRSLNEVGCRYADGASAASFARYRGVRRSALAGPAVHVRTPI
jgi:hypothetical protein